MGRSVLTLPPKVIFQELPPVEQNEVYKGLSFDYDVQVWANCEDRIELQVRNYNTSTSPDGWDKHGLKSYTGLDLYTNKTLTWYAVNLTLDNFRNGQGLYKVVGNISESQPYSGPTIEERFEDPRVSYKKTINELLSFDYEVTAWVNWVKDSIMLEVYNYTLHDWEEKGIRNYATPGKKQKLRWESINLSSDYFDDDHRGKYRFVGSYNKDELEIIGPTIEEKFYPLDVIEAFKKENCVGDAGYKFIFYRKGEFINETDINKGPYVIIAKFTNATVEPKNGTRERTFTYTVIVNATETGEVRIYWEDAMQNHSDDKSIGKCNTPNKEVSYLCNMTFEHCELGNITYWFKFESSKDTYSEKFAGPELIE